MKLRKWKELTEEEKLWIKEQAKFLAIWSLSEVAMLGVMCGYAAIHKRKYPKRTLRLVSDDAGVGFEIWDQNKAGKTGIKLGSVLFDPETSVEIGESIIKHAKEMQFNEAIEAATDAIKEEK